MSDEDFLRRCAWSEDLHGFMLRFHERARFRFFFHPRNRKDFFLNTLTTLQPEEQIFADADATVANRFQTLGSDLVDLGDSIPWHRDFKSGKEWPVRVLRNEEILDLGNPSDVKVPWELSRFHQVWWLGKAHWISGRDVYAAKYCAMTEDWIEQNPPGLGVNWGVAMEVAIRSVNWMAGYAFFCDSRSCDDAFWIRFLKSLYVHGEAIWHNLEYSRYNKNHFLSNVVGLVFLGTFFADMPFGQRWLEWGMKAIEREMQDQVHGDGVTKEQSTSYHRLVLELFTATAVLCKLTHRPLSPAFMQRLELMHEFVRAYTRDDGSVPLWGDADDGRLFRVSMTEDVNDHRHMLSTGAVLFDRGDLAVGGLHQETLWYLGTDAVERHRRFQPEPARQTSAFPEAGTYILRDERSQVFVDAGPLALPDGSGHGHNDTLSFTYWVDGAELLVDSGTYCYTSDARTRNAFRSSRAHNTLMVDDRELAGLEKLFELRGDHQPPRILQWSLGEDADVLEAEHRVHRANLDDILHRRKIVVEKQTGDLRIVDTIEAGGNHTLQWFFHLHPSVRVEEQRGRTIVVRNDSGRYAFSASTGGWEVVRSEYSPQYGILLEKHTLTLTLQWQIPFTQEIVVSRMPESSDVLA